MESKEILRIAANTLNEKKAMDLLAVEITDLTVIADCFLMATATSSTHVKALAAEVEDKLSNEGIQPHHIEGRATDWILIDYGSVVVHVFGKQSREFYALDKMWKDGKIINLEEILDSKLEEAQ